LSRKAETAAEALERVVLVCEESFLGILGCSAYVILASEGSCEPIRVRDVGFEFKRVGGE